MILSLNTTEQNTSARPGDNEGAESDASSHAIHNEKNGQISQDTPMITTANPGDSRGDRGTKTPLDTSCLLTLELHDEDKTMQIGVHKLKASPGDTRGQYPAYADMLARLDRELSVCSDRCVSTPSMSIVASLQTFRQAARAYCESRAYRFSVAAIRDSESAAMCLVWKLPKLPAEMRLADALKAAGYRVQHHPAGYNAIVRGGVKA